MSDPDSEDSNPEDLDHEAQRLARYLAGRPSSFWTDERMAVLRHVGQELADLCADLEGTSPQSLPADLPPMALVDLLLVVAHDLRIEAGQAPGSQGGAVRAGLAEIVGHRQQLDGKAPPRRWASLVAASARPCLVTGGERGKRGKRGPA